VIRGVHHLGIRVSKGGTSSWLDHALFECQLPWATCANVFVRFLDDTSEGANMSFPRPVQAPGIAHICLQSRDIDEGLARGVASGLVPISGPVDLGTDFRYLYAHAPDGILLELEGAPFVRDASPRFWVGHVAFVARDIVGLVDFYARALSLEPTGVSRLRPNPLFDKVTGLEGADLSAMWLPGFNLGLEFWQYHHPPAPPDQKGSRTGFDYICFETDDFEADCTQVLAQGACRACDRDVGLPNTQIASFEDPEGNVFSLIAFDNPDDPMASHNLPHRDILAKVAAQRPLATTF
jgi:catechol 2,3-dioxygenase-like lactoylglutathione lyase family enzyme